MVKVVMRAAVDGLEPAATLAEGHQLDAERAAPVPVRYIGRMLSRNEAVGLLDRIAPCGKQLRGNTRRRLEQRPPQLAALRNRVQLTASFGRRIGRLATCNAQIDPKTNALHFCALIDPGGDRHSRINEWLAIQPGELVRRLGRP
jgi:hypothetical protein